MFDHKQGALEGLFPGTSHLQTAVLGWFGFKQTDTEFECGTLDLLSEDNKNIFTEDGKSFLIIQRKSVCATVNTGSCHAHVEEWDGLYDVKITIKLGKKTFEQTKKLSRLKIETLMGIDIKLRNISTAVVNVWSKYIKHKVNPITVKIKKK